LNGIYNYEYKNMNIKCQKQLDTGWNSQANL